MSWATIISLNCLLIPQGVITNPNLADPYFNASYPVINTRIAQAGVRLAAFLNNLASATPVETL